MYNVECCALYNVHASLNTCTLDIAVHLISIMSLRVLQHPIVDEARFSLVNRCGSIIQTLAIHKRCIYVAPIEAIVSQRHRCANSRIRSLIRNHLRGLERIDERKGGRKRGGEEGSKGGINGWKKGGRKRGRNAGEKERRKREREGGSKGRITG